MAKIKIKDLSKDVKISKDMMKNISGGALHYSGGRRMTGIRIAKPVPACSIRISGVPGKDMLRL